MEETVRFQRIRELSEMSSCLSSSVRHFLPFDNTGARDCGEGITLVRRGDTAVSSLQGDSLAALGAAQHLCDQALEFFHPKRLLQEAGDGVGMVAVGKFLLHV